MASQPSHNHNSEPDPYRPGPNAEFGTYWTEGDHLEDIPGYDLSDDEWAEAHRRIDQDMERRRQFDQDDTSR